MWTCSKKLTAITSVIFVVIQLRILGWAVAVQHKEVAVMSTAATITDRNDAALPTLYEHYSAGGVVTGLVPTAGGFVLNGKSFRIISGAIHYFRVHPAYWRDRLRKLRATGANVVETYVPWNLHEPRKNQFDFGEGKNDMSLFLDVVKYIQIAKEEDLLVIFRPGPYICSEWDFGGLPSWLLRDPTMHVRTSYGPYIDRVNKFFEKLIPLVKDLQYTSAGNGPIIAVQVENEYGGFGYGDHPRDKAYLQHLSNKMRALGIKEMFLTSDSPENTLDWGAIPGALQTANLQMNPAEEFSALQNLQPNMPLMVTEFWSGWFDHWTNTHHKGLSLKDFESSLAEIFNYDASVSFYMFHGGTNFGFMNGANTRDEFPGKYLPDVTSYDYDAPLSEAGDYTDKYESICRMVVPVLPVLTRLPQRPLESPKKAYASIAIESFISFNDMINQVPKEFKVKSNMTLPMEALPTNDMNGQSYGFVVYRKTIAVTNSSRLKVRGHVRDFAQVLINGNLHTPPAKSREELDSFGFWVPRDATLRIGSWKAIERDGDAQMDIVVENMGRVNFGKPHDFVQRKGLWEGPILLDGNELFDWEIISLEFTGDWVRSLKNWKSFDKMPADHAGPVLVRATLNVQDPAADTFIDMSLWNKGVVFVNGFNLGRYWSTMGPQKTLYLPAPLLKSGENTIVIYEQYYPSDKVRFTDKPILGEKKP